MYQYKARDKYGKILTGIMEAESEEAVSLKLQKMGNIPISISKKQAQKEAITKFRLFNKVKHSEINSFTRLLFTLQKAGLPLLSSLKALHSQIENPVFKGIIKQISADVEAGATFSQALEKHPATFNSLYVNMVRSGEVSGKLAEILDRVATLGEHEEKIKTKVKGALRYPVLVVITMCIAFTVLIVMVVPRFETLFSQYTTELPLPTQLLIFTNIAIRQFWWLIMIIIVALAFTFMKIVKTTKGLYQWDKFKLKIPVFGDLILKVTISRFCNITSTLMKSGVPIMKVLELAEKSVGNSLVAGVINKIGVAVNSGKGMLEPMEESGLFPPVVTQMVSAGEQTGELPELLNHVSEYYDEQVEHTIENLVSLIEPMLLFGMGMAVTILALGIFMPMWSLISLFD